MKTNSNSMVNLIPRAHLEQRLRLRWMSRWGAAIVSTVIVIGIPGMYIGGAAALTDSGMSEQIAEMNMEYARHQQAIPVLQKRLGLLVAEQKVFDLVASRIEWRAVFAVLIRTAQSDIRFRRINATGGGIEGDLPIQIYIEGLAPTQTIARAYVVGLEESNIFDAVELVETTREQINEIELVRFQIEVMVLGDMTELEGENDDE